MRTIAQGQEGEGGEIVISIRRVRITSACVELLHLVDLGHPLELGLLLDFNFFRLGSTRTGGNNFTRLVQHTLKVTDSLLKSVPNLDLWAAS